MSEKLPPLVQEIRSDASQAIAEQDKFNESTRHMAEHSDEAGKRAHGGFASMALGMGIANLAADGVEKTLEGLHKTIEAGVERAKDDAQINAQLAAGIQSTGGAAGTTVQGMNELAESIARMSGQSADSIGKTESLLLTFTNIKNVGADKIFDETTLAAANMAARFGGDATQSAIQLGKALNDPTQGMTALRRVGVSFTADQIAQVKALQASGDMMGAQKIILAELTTEFGGSAKAAGETLPGAIARAKESFEEMSGRIVTAFMPVMTEVFSHLVNLFQSMAPHIEAFAEMLSSGLEKVGPILAPIGQAFSGLVGPLAQAAGAVSPFGIMLKALGPILPEIARTVSQLATELGSTLGKVLAVLTPILAQVTSTLAGGLMSAFTALGPVIPVIASAVGDLAQALGTGLGQVLTTLAPVLEQVASMFAGALAQTISALVPVISQLAEVIGQILGKALTALAPVLVMAAQFIGDLLKVVAPLIGPVLQLATVFWPLLAPIVQLVGSLLVPLIQLLTTLLQPILQLVTAIIGALVPAISAVVTWFSSNLSPVIQAAQQVIQGISDFIGGTFSGNWSRAWQGIQSAFSGVWDGITSIASGAINGVIDLINGLIGSIDDGLSALKNLSGGLINLNIPKIPHFADGGEVPGPSGGAVPAVVHGGEFVLSQAMREGRQPIPQAVRDAIGGGPGTVASVVGGGTVINQYVDVTQTDPSAEDIAAALGFHLRLVQ